MLGELGVRSSRIQVESRYRRDEEHAEAAGAELGSKRCNDMPLGGLRTLSKMLPLVCGHEKQLRKKIKPTMMDFTRIGRACPADSEGTAQLFAGTEPNSRESRLIHRKNESQI